MRNRRLSVVAFSIAITAAAAVMSALLVGQAPNHEQMVTRTVSGVQFGTLRGFVVERMNPPDKPDSYVVVTFDSLGRPVVSKEQDHPRILLDDDKDGIYESERVFSDKVRNCQGLWFDGRSLYGVCMPADSPQGQEGGNGASASVFRMTDTNADDVADTFEQVSPLVGGIAEHGPHAIRRGPDGKPAMIAGNFSTPSVSTVDPKSVLLDSKDRQFLPVIEDWRESADDRHSAVYQLDPVSKRWTVLFSGNRNAYDFAYNVHGEAFTFDSDMEYDINLPWYRDVRTIHGIQGGDYGYRNNSGKYPPYYLDSLPAVRDLGRGSPVGVEFYQHYAYPREFFDNLLEADWSRGRLLYTALTPKGATYSARQDRAEFVHGEPMNITDLEVGPDGLVYFTTGGRSTEGGFWRIRYTGAPPPRPDTTGILAVVRQPQPLSSWGWAAIERAKASMGASFGTELERVARDGAATGIDRARAIYELQRHGPEPAVDLLQALISDRNPDVRRSVSYVAGLQGERAKAVAAAALKDSDAMVKRRAAEALVRMGQSPDKPSLAPVGDIYALVGDADRFVRWAGRLLLERTPRREWTERATADTNAVSAPEAMLALADTANGESLQPIIEKQFAMMKRTDLSVENRLRLLRAFEYTTTEIERGLTPSQREQLHGLVVHQFPSSDERLNRELALILAYAGQPQAIAKILAAMPKGDENQPLQIHYAYALRTIKEGWTPEQKLEYARWLGKAARWRGGSSYARFLGQIFDQSMEVYTDEEKLQAYRLAPDYAPLTEDEIAELEARQAAAQAARSGGAGRGGRGAQPGQTTAAGRGAQPAPAQAAGRGGRAGNRGNQTALARRSVGLTRTSKQEIFEYQIFVPQRQEPDAAIGRQIFEKDCASCHRFGALGADLGQAGPPSLTAIMSRSNKREVLESILWPSNTVAAEHETTAIDTTDGRTIEGLVLKEDARTVTLKTASEQALVDLQKASIKARRKIKTSIMPETLLDSYSQQEIAGLLAFLMEQPPAGTTASR